MSLAIFCIMKKIGPNMSEMTLIVLSLIMDVTVIIMLIFAFRPTIPAIKTLLIDVINKVNKKEIIYVVLFKLLVTIGGVKMLIDFLHLIDENIINGFIYDMVIKIDGPVEYIISIIILCLLSPVIEELVFRNVVFRRISKKFNIKVGMIISSIVFAAINVGNGIAGAFIFGIANCIIYTKYKNIFMPILINVLYNVLLSAFIIPIFCSNFDNILFNTQYITISFSIECLMFISGIILFIKFFKKNKKYLGDYNIELRSNL